MRGETRRTKDTEDKKERRPKEISIPAMGITYRHTRVYTFLRKFIAVLCSDQSSKDKGFRACDKDDFVIFALYNFFSNLRKLLNPSDIYNLCKLLQINILISRESFLTNLVVLRSAIYTHPLLPAPVAGNLFQQFPRT